VRAERSAGDLGARVIEEESALDHPRAKIAGGSLHIRHQSLRRGELDGRKVYRARQFDDMGRARPAIQLRRQRQTHAAASQQIGLLLGGKCADRAVCHAGIG